KKQIFIRGIRDMSGRCIIVAVADIVVSVDRTLLNKQAKINHQRENTQSDDRNYASFAV
ncbi:hypothetical protein HYW82_04270, partial [Candidatus Peregrinibacteria bacterium]|nr:hypothetical protein [Candidatus Peregrinibacteria bacterium]